MSLRLRREIRQKKPFGSPEEELFLEVQRSADMLMRGLEGVLKPSGLTQTQYNVLRILRGAGPEGLVCHEVAERMVTRDPDVTRLLDRLESRGLVTRTRESGDRRVVRASLTESGISLLGRLDFDVAELHRRQLGHLGRAKLGRLVGLLAETRAQLT